MGIKCPKCQTDNPNTQKFCGECATPLPSSEEIPVTETLETPKEELTTGSTFAGRYQIIEELGKGGMGKVYRVLDKELKEEVALKLIKPEIASDKKTLERFSNELKLARKISHKNVGRMYELMEEKGTRYITMEYVPGEDLKRLIRKVGQFSAGKTVSIAKQVCEGLSEAHRLGVVHRDLKPQNIMVDEEGNARILDFGIARSLRAKGITGAGVMIGTPEYMSPEQAEVKEVDQRSDIYSLGVILYEMVTGRVPFEGETPLGVAMKHKSETPKDPRELNTQIPEELSRVILRCMEKDKEKRYQSAGEVRSELENIEKGIPTTERVIPKRKSITSKEITFTFGLKKLLIPALVGVALVIAMVLIWKPWSQKEAVPIPSDNPSLAVMYFKNNTGDKRLDHWKTMLSNLLIADLAQSRHLRILSEDRLFNILGQLNELEAETYSYEVLKHVATKGGVNHILQGAYAKAGEEFRINVTLQDVSTGELLGSESVAGKGEESIFSMVDELTRRIKANFKLSEEQIVADIDKEVGKITTSSPEAYEFYTEGRKHHMNIDYRRSILLMEKAVAIDPEFAMAYRSMAASYSNLGYYAEGDKYLQKALELSERLSDKERIIIQGNFYAYKSRTQDKALELFKELIQLYPEDRDGRAYLGWMYMKIEEWEKAIEQFEIARQEGDQRILIYGNLWDCYCYKRMHDKAREILDYYLANISENAWVHSSISMVYMYQGKLDMAMVEVNKAFSLAPDNYIYIEKKGDIFLYKGDLIKAEREYQNLLEHQELTATVEGIRRVGALYLLQGKFEKAKAQVRQGIELSKRAGQAVWEAWYYSASGYLQLKSGNFKEALDDYDKEWDYIVEKEDIESQIINLYYRGLTYLEMNALDKAQRAADEMKEWIRQGINRKIDRYHLHLLGMIELKSKKFSKAIELFKKAIALDRIESHAIFIAPLGLAYYKSGNLDMARKEFERIISLTAGRLDYGDIYAKSFYMLGKINEQQGNKAKAIEHYEKFLDLWKEADSGIAEVEDARERLVGLKSQ